MDIKKCYKKLAENIKLQRVKLDITQSELAKLANLSRDTVSQLERGVCNPTLATVIAIADALNVELNVLLPLK